MSPSADSGSGTKASAATIAGQGSSVLDPGIPVVPALAKIALDRDTGNGSGMAPKWLESLLALVFSTQRTIGTKNHPVGREASRSSHGDRELPVGQKRIQAELARMGIMVSARTVAKYMRGKILSEITEFRFSGPTGPFFPRAAEWWNAAGPS